ncbi:putative Ig domain-containing protein [Streptomyces sp. H10-C2]|uniref:putative Ig domain-containing protein n=1 Tax=unclassified Streptomyces TaxID=2593676 RepID=UPI0024B9BF01|nr:MULTISPECIES: putative Ig domain-containing protein [unclassified Streptomyces]MDJ0344470.1 putative Ig domain-containing protein [Streptomyces sp. PH10-H1]MDJ0372054.1 putative Ig domain-containing protein [Streptomyces sp. H10-C2]
MGTPHIRGAARAALTAFASLSLISGALIAVGAPQAAADPPAPQPQSHSVTNPYSPAYQHPYRHGAVPTIPQNAAMKTWAATQASPHVATGPQTLSYGGGIDGIGVTSGHSKVYLVFYGTQWGTQSTDANGNAKFSGDANNAAPAAQQMFKGIGTNNELWSADLTQWCDGPNVATGATSCPSNANFIPYQSGGVLAGVWYDNAAASPGTASGHQLGQEAVNAAAHFGNTTAAANRDAYYVILSPHGTNPDSYQNQYCAWHDYNGDTTLTGGAVNSPYGDIAFSNQPYNIDSGAGCGVGFVNSPGTLDGWTMTLGHEWQETMSDQNPAGGWTNKTGSSYNGQENSDECAWLNPGTTGGAANINLGTGTFAEQASWSNDTNSCAISHPIVGGPTGNTVTVTNPGSQSSVVNTAVTLQMRATDSASGQTLTYAATGLPAGLTISSTTGLISGTPTTTGSSTVTVTAQDTTSAVGSTSFSWTVSTSQGGGAITNGGFETGNLSSWTTSGSTAAGTAAAHSGSYGAMVGSANPSGTSSITQSFTAPTGSTKVSFWYNLTCPDTLTYDWATATLKDNTSNTTQTVLAKTCTNGAGWKNVTGTLTAGHSYTLTLTSKDDNYAGDATYTYYDDVAVS